MTKGYKMKIHPKSRWNETRIVEFLENSNFPIRISFLDESNEPHICSLWYKYGEGELLSASHKNSFLIRQLMNKKIIAFEVSSNEYPYKGVRGKATIELSTINANTVLRDLISKYLGSGNAQLSSWLMSRTDDEYVIRIIPSTINSWDFSDRMEK